MAKKQKRSHLKTLIEFLKLQIAGNILFVGTLVGTFVGDRLLHAPETPTLIVSSILANILFFIVDREWVFTKKGRKRNTPEVYKFAVFMTFNFVVNIVLIKLIAGALRAYTPELTGFEIYIGQCGAAVFFSVWTYVGLKFWVFAPSHHHAFTYHSLPRHGNKRA